VTINDAYIANNRVDVGGGIKVYQNRAVVNNARIWHNEALAGNVSCFTMF
jgi:hypothetical protein